MLSIFIHILIILFLLLSSIFNSKYTHTDVHALAWAESIHGALTPSHDMAYVGVTLRAWARSEAVGGQASTVMDVGVRLTVDAAWTGLIPSSPVQRHDGLGCH